MRERKQSSFTLGDATLAQLRELVTASGRSQTREIELAVDAWHRATLGGESLEKRVAELTARVAELETKGQHTMGTIYVCGKCGETSAEWETTDDWLIASVPGKPGEMVIRCPDHITEHTIRKAGGHVEDGKGVVNMWVYELHDEVREN